MFHFQWKTVIIIFFGEYILFFGIERLQENGYFYGKNKNYKF